VRATGLDFLESSMRPWPTQDASTRLAVVTPTQTRVAIYDNALVALVLDQVGRHDEAGRVLEALSMLQREDGAIPFSFELARATTAPLYVRSGALAWVGYAAVDYLDTADGGPARDAVVRMAHRIAAYLDAHTVRARADARAGLVTGGEGDLVYEMTPHGVEENFVPGNVAWASVEHNVDGYFFLRALGRSTGQPSYTASAERIAQALLAKAWDGDAGQMRRGVNADETDAVLALDCASWGSLFLAAAGSGTRAETSAATADARFASHDPKSGVFGHRPYARGPVLEDADLRAYYSVHGIPTDWSSLEGVWPEGSAGVALALLRSSRRERAMAVLAELERLREPSGGLPMMTAAVPFEFETGPSVAGTAWVEIVRAELEPGATPRLWSR